MYIGPCRTGVGSSGTTEYVKFSIQGLELVKERIKLKGKEEGIRKPVVTVLCRIPKILLEGRFYKCSHHK